MKKIVSLFLALILAFSFSCSAFAAVFTFDEFGLSYNIPEYLLSVTKDSSEDDKIFTDYLYYDETMQYMNELGLCLYAISEDLNTEFTLEISKDENYYDFSDYSKLQLDLACDEIKETWESYGYENCVSDTYSNDLTTFITISYDYAYDDYRVYGLDYIAYIDGNYTVFCLYSYYDGISEDENETMKGIADSIVSTNVVPEEESSGISLSGRGVIKTLRWVITAVVAGIGGLFAWIKKKGGKNKNASSENPVQPGENTADESVPEESFEPIAEETPSGGEDLQKCCSACGAPLSGDEKFCTVCGNKIK